MGRRRRRGARRAPVLLTLLLVALAAVYLALERDAFPTASLPPPAAGSLRVHYVDVGQGDGTIWELPDGSIVVYDCGPPAPDAASNPMVHHLREALGRAPGSRIDALIASHGHLDHIGGCEEVLSEYVVADIYEAWYEGDDSPASYHRFLAQVEAEGATLHRLPELAPGPLESVRGAELLWPRAFAPGGWDAIAEASLVVRLQHGSTSFCFQGDIEDRQERMLSAKCDVYLVGHHGSRHASSAAWLAQMGPSIAVASFGENPYGHPHPEAMCRIQQAGTDLYTTARSGTIIVASDGASARVVQGERETADACAIGG